MSAAARAAARRAERIVANKTPAQARRIRARAENEFDYLLADALFAAVLKAARAYDVRYSLTPAGHALLESAAV